MEAINTIHSIDTSGALTASEYLFDDSDTASKLYTNIDKDCISLNIDDSNIKYDETPFNINKNAGKVGILTYQSFNETDRVLLEHCLYISSTSEKILPLTDWKAPIEQLSTKLNQYIYTLNYETSGALKFLTSVSNDVEIKPHAFDKKYNNKVYRGNTILIERDINSQKYKQLKLEKDRKIEDLTKKIDEYLDEGKQPPLNLLQELLNEQNRVIMPLGYSLHIPSNKLKKDIDSIYIVAYIKGCGLEINGKEIPGQIIPFEKEIHDDRGWRLGLFPINIPKNTNEITIREIPQHDSLGQQMSASIELYGVLEGERILNDTGEWKYNFSNYKTGTVEIGDKSYDLKKDYITYTYEEGLTMYKAFLTEHGYDQGFESIKINYPTINLIKDQNNFLDHINLPVSNFIDGIYSTYCLVVPEYDMNKEYTKDQIVYYKNEYWVNITGENNTHPINFPYIERKPNDWQLILSFNIWKNYIKLLNSNIHSSIGYYSETQNLIITSTLLNTFSELEYLASLIYSKKYKLKDYNNIMYLQRLLYLIKDQFYSEAFLECSRYINSVRRFLPNKDIYNDNK